jgi:2-polyprenyl-3-methyl-5-hydroxy-6-metoxy-1,4-benzoquinol methylase
MPYVPYCQTLIGCGAGRDAAFMASLGCRVTATDTNVAIKN